MGLIIPPNIFIEHIQYEIEYRKKNDSVRVSAPTEESAKALLEHVLTKLGWP